MLGVRLRLLLELLVLRHQLLFQVVALHFQVFVHFARVVDLLLQVLFCLREGLQVGKHRLVVRPVLARQHVLGFESLLQLLNFVLSLLREDGELGETDFELLDGLIFVSLNFRGNSVQLGGVFLH